MARIPKEEVDRLNRDVDLVGFIGQWVELKKAGNEHKGLSPFTNEKTPSFYVNQQKMKWFDHSSGKNGNAVDFVVEHQKLPFRDAIRIVSEYVGRDLSPYLDNALSEQDQKAFRARTAALNGMKEAQAQFVKLLIDREQGLPYRQFAKRRGLTIELIREYGVGAAPPAYPLPAAAQLPDCGLLAEAERRRYLRFRDRLMFPVRNQYGDIVTFAGRALNVQPKPDGPKIAKYLNGPETALFHKTAVLYGLYEANARLGRPGKMPELLLVEGYLDVISLSAEGLDAAAPMGAALSESQIQLAARYADILYFCTDGDAGGHRGERRTLERTLPLLGELAAEVRVVKMPDGLDPDDLVRKQGGAAMRQLMDRALTAVEAAVEWVVGPNWSSLRPEAKAQQFASNAEMIAAIRDPIMRDSAIQLLESRCGFSAQAIRAKLDSLTEAKDALAARRASANGTEPAASAAPVQPSPPAARPSASPSIAPSKPVVSGAQELMDRLGQGESLDDEPDHQEHPVASFSGPGSMASAIRKVYLSGQSVGAAGAEITRADMLRRSPPLRAAQLLLCYEHLDVREADAAFLCSPAMSCVRGGPLLTTVAQAALGGETLDLSVLEKRLPDDGQRPLLYYLLEERPHLPPAAATAVFAGLVEHCRTLVRDTQLAELMSISETRELTRDELRQLQHLLPPVALKPRVDADASASTGPGY